MDNKEPTDQSKFVGVWIPQRTNSFLSLLALSKGVSKSKIVRDVVDDITFPLITDMIESIAVCYQQKWKDKKHLYYRNIDTIDTAFQIYKGELEIHLLRKGIAEGHVKLILEKLEQ